MPTRHPSMAKMVLLIVARCALPCLGAPYGANFLEQHAKDPAVTVLPSGLQYRVITPGRRDGETPTMDADCEVDYEGRLAQNGKLFDSSFKRGQPSVFKPTKVVKGFREALLLMSEGAKWEIVCPPELAYGSKKKGRIIPAFSTLIFEITLIRVKHGPDGWAKNGAVVHLDESLFDGFREKNPQMMTFFYAPWCGHCKNFKPQYVDASRELKGMVPLTAVDCTANKGLCNTFEVDGFPTVMYFNTTTDTGTIYKGQRTADELIPKVKEFATGLEAFTHTEKMLSWKEYVQHLNVGPTYDDFTKDNEKIVKMIMFYSPTCGISKAMMPHYGLAAKRMAATTGQVAVGAVNCIENKQLCSGVGITGFPTMVAYFPRRPHGAQYQGRRNADGITQYLNRALSISQNAGQRRVKGGL